MNFIPKSEGTDVHVMPINDLREHKDARDCWCGPAQDDPGLWVHHSMDRREEFEQGRKPS